MPPIEGHLSAVAAPAPAAPRVVSSFGVAALAATPPAPAPAPVTEAPKTTASEAKPAEEGTKTDAWRFEELTRRDRSNREEAKRLKAEKAAIAAEREQLKASNARREQDAQTQIVERYRTDPAAFMNDFGVDYYNRVSQFIAQGGYTPGDMAARQLQAAQSAAQSTAQKLEEFKKEQAAQAERARVEAVEDRARAETEAIADFKAEIGQFVLAEPDAYEMIGVAGPQAIEEIYRRIDEHYSATGLRLSTKEAADAVEAVLLEEARAVLQKSKKLRAPGGQSARSLSNRMAPPPGEPARAETEKERKARVIGLINRAWGRG